jgi:3-isopropylmalate dehydrogenase
VNPTIGLVSGGGTGPELITSLCSCIAEVERWAGVKFDVQRFDDAAAEAAMEREIFDAGLYAELRDFHEAVRGRRGAVIRGSVPAPVLYRLRSELDLAAHVVPLNPFPQISLAPRLRVVLLRESSQGLYHPKSVVRRPGSVAITAEWQANTLRYLAKTAFALAQTHGLAQVTTVLKTSVLGELGELWLEAFRDASRCYPGIEYAHRPSGAGFSDMWLEPERFGVVVTDDEAGDILADLVPSVLYRSRNLVPTGSFSPFDYVSYQTDHGTIRPLRGTGQVNPLAMISALALALRHSFGMAQAADALQNAVGLALAEGCRTADLYQGSLHTRLSTREMTERVLRGLGRSPAATA